MSTELEGLTAEHVKACGGRWHALAIKAGILRVGKDEADEAFGARLLGLMTEIEVAAPTDAGLREALEAAADALSNADCHCIAFVENPFDHMDDCFFNNAEKAARAALPQGGGG